MHIHILGICGTFMAGVASLAREKGFKVTGCDENVYPPMSDLLTRQGISMTTGYDVKDLPGNVDIFVIGNAMKRGNPLVEHILNRGLSYMSGPAWLSEYILRDLWVLGVAGTHGKTTTSSLLAWILEEAGLVPGFLIGGVPENFSVSARLGGSPFFVIESDEYDSAFFDKRSKFIHYRPRTLVLNNLEFDHADIFSSLDEIKRQFHHLVRTVPSEGLIIRQAKDANLDDVMAMGSWTPSVSVGDQGDWQARSLTPDWSSFEVLYHGDLKGQVAWQLMGQHNVHNALSAMTAAHHAGVSLPVILDAVKTFKSVKRRLEKRGCFRGVTVYDDFAHHPTAIAATVLALRQKVGAQRIVAVLECGSFTMRTGVHAQALGDALQGVDLLFCRQCADSAWSLEDALQNFQKPHRHYEDIHAMIDHIYTDIRAGDHVLVMSNTGFAGFHDRLLTVLQSSN